MIELRDIIEARKKRLDTKEPLHKPVPAVVVAVEGSIRHPWKPNHFWIKLYNQPEGITDALSKTISLVDGLPVWVEQSPKPPHTWIITSVYTEGVAENITINIGEYASAPHAPSHRVFSESSIGNDPLYIFQAAIKILKTDVVSDLSVFINPYNYVYAGTRHGFTGQLLDLATYQPIAGLVKYVLIYLDPTTGLIGVLEGTSVVDNNVVPIPKPSIPANVRPSAYVKLKGSATSLTMINDVIDCRDFLVSEVSKLFGATSIGEVAYSLDGVTLTAQKPVIDNGVWIADNGKLIIDTGP
jgi:hypothetical protein